MYRLSNRTRPKCVLPTNFAAPTACCKCSTLLLTQHQRSCSVQCRAGLPQCWTWVAALRDGAAWWHRTVRRLLLQRQLVRGGRSPPAAPSVPDSQKVWAYTDPQAQSKEYAEGRGSLKWLLQAQRRAARAQRLLRAHAPARSRCSRRPARRRPAVLACGHRLRPLGSRSARRRAHQAPACTTREPASGTLTAQSRHPFAGCVAQNHQAARERARRRGRGPAARRRHFSEAATFRPAGGGEARSPAAFLREAEALAGAGAAADRRAEPPARGGFAGGGRGSGRGGGAPGRFGGGEHGGSGGWGGGWGAPPAPGYAAAGAGASGLRCAPFCDPLGPALPAGWRMAAATAQHLPHPPSHAGGRPFCRHR